MTAYQSRSADPMTSLEPLPHNVLDGQARVLAYIVRGRPLAQSLDELCRLVERYGGPGLRASILLAEGRDLRLVQGAAPSLPASFAALGDDDRDVGSGAVTAARGTSTFTPDLASDPAWSGSRDVPLSLGLRAVWSEPILSAAGEVLGVFRTWFAEAREPTREERRLIQSLAPTAALAIERHRVDEALRGSERRHRFLAELAEGLKPLTDPSAMLTLTARMLAEHLGADRCAYAEIEDERIFVIHGDHPRGVGMASIVGRWPVSAFGPECTRSMLDGEAFVVVDSESDARIGPEDVVAYRATMIRSVVCVPLHKQGRFTAAMAVHQRTAREWTAAEVELVRTVVARSWEALERARVTRTLVESEERYRTMVQASPDCVMVLSREGTLEKINPAGQALLDASQESELLGHAMLGFIAPEHRAPFQEFCARAYDADSGRALFDVVAPSGRRRSLEFTAVPLPAAHGQRSLLCLARDVTASVTAERALAQSRARLDYAVRLSGVGFWYCDLPFDELIWDERVKEHFFLAPDARVTIDTFYERIHPDDRVRTEQAIETSIRERRPYDIVYRTTDPSSSRVKFIRALGGTAYGADDEPSRFDGVTVDVTVQEQAQAAVERERSKLQRMFVEAPFALGMFEGPDHRIVLANRRWEDVVGTPLPKGVPLLEALPALVTREVRQFHDRALAGETVVVERLSIKVDTSRGDSRERQFHCVYQPLREADGAMSGHLAMAVEVTEEVLAREELEGARREAERANRAKDEFLALLGHELRNPLAPISTALQLMELRGISGCERELEIIGRQVQHLTGLVDDLLDVSRIARGKVELRRQRVELAEVVARAIETASPLFELRHQNVSIDVPSRGLCVDVDPIRMQQVVVNLLTNAAKYSDDGGSIRVAAVSEGSHVVLRVIDSGMGIDADVLPNVFELFVQEPQALDRSRGGLGLGLAIVRSIVSLHGGAVSARSEGRGRGSEFVVRLPLIAPTSSASALTPPNQTIARADASLQVLVVDDNEDGAELLCEALTMHGHAVRVAHDAPAALKVLTDFTPDVAILDIGLPGMDGYELAGRVRERLASIRLIALTGYGQPQDRERSRAAGFDAHLVKPLDLAMLSAVLGSFEGQ